MNVYLRIRSELLVALGLAVAWCNHKYNWGLTVPEVLSFFGGLALVVCKHWHLDAKYPEAAGLLKAALKGSAGILIAVLALGTSGGCANISPTTIQADVALGVASALQGALVGDPAIDKQLKADAAVVAKLINGAVLPQFQGAKLGAVAANAGPQALALLQSKITGMKNGSKVLAEIKLWAPVALGAIASVNSPGSYLSPQAQADLAAFFTGASQGISAFVGDPSLMPPVPPAVPAPTSPAVPAPVPAPTQNP